MNTGLVFLKLGGSLITDKDRPSTPRRAVLRRLAQEVAAAKEIAAARAGSPDFSLLLGHGSGSYGHTAARKHGTRQGVHTAQDWLGFAEVWKEARALNEIVIDAFSSAGLPVIAFPPSAAVTANGGQAARWDLAPLRAALSNGLVPVIQGDVIFDETLGGTILSTEDLFVYLAHQLHPARILLAGLEPGVWADFPSCTRLLDSITPQTISAFSSAIGGSASVDVTGGMRQKVQSMLDLAAEIPGFEASIFSGKQPGLLTRALLGEKPGTTLHCIEEHL